MIQIKQTTAILVIGKLNLRRKNIRSIYGNQSILRIQKVNTHRNSLNLLVNKNYVMKIYTKTGDQGQTSLVGGQRVSKGNMRIESYGTVDELNSFIGALRDGIKQGIKDRIQNDINPDTHYNFKYDIENGFPDGVYLKQLVIIQNHLFDMGSHLATSDEKSLKHLPELEEEWIRELEMWIDDMMFELTPLNTFILPGGHTIVSSAHICRSVCRRAERTVVVLADEVEVNMIISKYLNRLSDYFFTLGRMISKLYNAPEIPWIPKKR